MNLPTLKKPVIARQTLELIAQKIEEDQGAAFRGWQRKFMPLMGDAYDDSPHEPRSHLGASVIGNECAREIFYSWRWAQAKKASAKMIRLWNRGHLEEARFLAILKTIGCDVWHQTPEGQQYRIIGYRGHFGGGCDAIVRGIPEMPTIPILGEFKTHNAKSFDELEDKGVRAAKFTHYVQMSLYMQGLHLSHALYLAVNKNTDELYAEIVEFDEQVANRFGNRSAEIIEAKEIPRRISESPMFWKCKFCDFHKLCHDRRMKPEANCRTCKHSAIGDNGSWNCTRLQKTLSKSEQMAGCSLYSVHSSME